MKKLSDIAARTHNKKKGEQTMFKYRILCGDYSMAGYSWDVEYEGTDRAQALAAYKRAKNWLGMVDVHISVLGRKELKAYSDVDSSFVESEFEEFTKEWLEEDERRKQEEAEHYVSNLKQTMSLLWDHYDEAMRNGEDAELDYEYYECEIELKSMGIEFTP